MSAPSTTWALPTTAESDDPFVFFPSRLAPLKRQRLVIEAVARSRTAVCLRFAGFAADTPAARALVDLARECGVADRVQLLGELDDDALIARYGAARGVVFPPYDEDYGYVTAEAMLAGRPVVTCADSGGPLEMVVDGETGWIAEPTPDALAAALDALWNDPALARERGVAGRRRIDALDLSWDRIVERLTA